MTDSELLAEIVKTAIIPFIEELSDINTWDLDAAYDAWDTVHTLFMSHRQELIKEIKDERMKEEKNRKKQELEKQLLQIQTELKNL